MVFVDTNDWRLVHWTPASGAATYFDPPERVGHPMVDSGTLVWVRYADGDDAGIAHRAELWTSAFVRDAAAITSQAQPNFRRHRHRRPRSLCVPPWRRRHRLHR